MGLKKWLYAFVMLLTVCLAVAGGQHSRADAVLTLPAQLQVIEAEAFYGDSSLGTVVLNAGIREIRSRAFANSSLTSIALPASLTFIADDAFDGPEKVTVTAAEGSYAWDWAIGHGYITDAPVQNAPAGGLRAVTVNWTPFSGATGYVVCYGTQNDISAATEVTGIAADAATYTITGLQAGTTYYTWVRAVTAGGTSGPSNMRSVITRPALPVLQTPVVSGNTIALSWSEAAGAGSYIVAYGTRNSYDAAAKRVVSGNGYTITELEYSTEYYIWVGSMNDSGAVRPANPVTAEIGIDPAAPVQSAPTGGAGKVTVQWAAVDGAESYTVYYGTSEKITSALKAYTGITRTSYTIQGLDAGTTYYTWVKAVLADGQTGPSNRESALTASAAPVLGSHEVSGNTLSLSWEAVPSAVIYRLYYSTKATYDSTATRVDNIRTTSYTISGLDFSTTYYLWLASANGSGGLRTPEAVSFTTEARPRTPVQAAPATATATGGARTVTVSWGAVPGAESYDIYYGTSSDLESATVQAGVVGAGSYMLEDLLPGTVYYTWVSAVAKGVESEPSERKSITTIPAAPTLNDPVVSGNSVTLSWNAVDGAIEYRLKYGTSDDHNAAQQINHIRDTSYTITDLEYGTTYYFWIISANTSGGTRNTNAKTATTEAQ